jgi:hypothetical protein
MVGSKNLAQTTTEPMHLWLHGLQSDFSLFLVSYSIGPFAKLTSSWPIHKPPSRWSCTWSFLQGFTPSTGIQRIMSSNYSPTSKVKSKPFACGTAILSPSCVRLTSSNHLLMIVSFIEMMSFSLSTLMRESSWDIGPTAM